MEFKKELQIQTCVEDDCIYVSLDAVGKCMRGNKDGCQ